MKRLLGTVLLSVTLLSACDGFFGKKTDRDFIDVPTYTDKQVAYVPIQPVWDGFTAPGDIIAGYDELMYIVDEATEEIISVDLAGNEIGRIQIPGLTDIAMDRTLDILALGTFDTLGLSLPAIYRIEQKNAIYGLSGAVIEDKIVHPFYFKSGASAGDANVSFNSIDVRADNRFYVTRSGPSNSSTQLGGPDDAVLIFPEDFTNQQQFSPITIQTEAGFFSDYFRSPHSITTIAKPPQSPFVSSDGDFVFTSLSGTTLLKVQYINVTESDNGVSYTVRDMPIGDTSTADGFMLEPDRFATPLDVTYTGDGTNYIFVVDAEKDSLYQFTNTGLEGVKPPAGSNDTKNILVSFGGTGTALTQFNQPSGVAYLDRTLYVADKGNGRILRFKLTTDLD